MFRSCLCQVEPSAAGSVQHDTPAYPPTQSTGLGRSQGCRQGQGRTLPAGAKGVLLVIMPERDATASCVHGSQC
jgi:hypothetical protein